MFRTFTTKSEEEIGWDALIYDKIDEIFDHVLPNGEKVVPDMGEASTPFGEAIRQIAKLVYRYYNDGDVAYATVGEEDSTVNEAVNYLAYSCKDSRVRQKAYALMTYVTDHIGDVLDILYLRDTYGKDVADKINEDFRDEFEASGYADDYDCNDEDEYDELYYQWLNENYGYDSDIEPGEVDDYDIQEYATDDVNAAVRDERFSAGYEYRLHDLAQAVYTYANIELAKFETTEEQLDADLDYYDEGWGGYESGGYRRW